MKILYVTTISNTVNAFLIPHIKMLVDQGHQVDVAFSIEREVRPEIYEMGCQVHALTLHRSPFGKGNYQAYRKLKQIILDEKYDLVHTHTPVASACVRLACRKIRNTKVFYTAHGFHFYKGAPLKNWLIYYPIEKWLSIYTDTIITINKEDYERANKLFKARRVEYVPGVGIDLTKFKTPIIDKKIKRQELGIPEDATLLISVGELNENKNHETVIHAIAGMDVYYIIAGQGDKKEHLEKVAEEVGMSDRVKLLGYRKDVNELYVAADVFVFPSFREGLSVSLIEAMASGLPCAVSRIRGNIDLIDEHGGILFDPHFANDIKMSIEKLLEYNRNTIGAYNINKIKGFSVDIVINQMKTLYNHY